MESKSEKTFDTKISPREDNPLEGLYCKPSGFPPGRKKNPQSPVFLSGPTSENVKLSACLALLEYRVLYVMAHREQNTSFMAVVDM
jgi:hypothetical protein